MLLNKIVQVNTAKVYTFSQLTPKIAENKRVYIVFRWNICTANPSFSDDTSFDANKQSDREHKSQVKFSPGQDRTVGETFHGSCCCCCCCIEAIRMINKTRHSKIDLPQHYLRPQCFGAYCLLLLWRFWTAKWLKCFSEHKPPSLCVSLLGRRWLMRKSMGNGWNQPDGPRYGSNIPVVLALHQNLNVSSSIVE